MHISFTADGWRDYQYWHQTDRQIIKKINQLINDILREPFDGIGKPEPLKHHLSGAWSRRITQEHRMVYIVKGEEIVITQCRHHYQSN